MIPIPFLWWRMRVTRPTVSTSWRLFRPCAGSISRSMATMKPSTIDSGYILAPTSLQNPLTSDSAYQRILSWYLPPSILKTLTPRLARFGDEAISDETHALISNAERQQPYVKTRDVWGNKYAYDRLITSQGWKELGKWGASNGYVRERPKYCDESDNPSV